MKNGVFVNPELILWARQRAGIGHDELQKKFKQISQWESGAARPSFLQLQAFADAVHVPIGYLFLGEVPEEPKPIADFRNIGSGEKSRYSLDLMDTIYQCQARQDWYRDYVRSEGFAPLPWVGSFTPNQPTSDAAKEIRNLLGVLEIVKSKEDYLSQLSSRMEDCGVLVMKNGVVGSSNRRKLSIEEFRGLALVDEWAPVIFINSNDAKSAQIFTLLHEFAHLLLGKNYSGVAGEVMNPEPLSPVENWCNRVAAEFLLPEGEILSSANGLSLEEQLQSVKNKFFVSKFVILLRFKQLRLIDQDDFETHWASAKQSYLEEIKPKMNSSSETKPGGNFYYNLAVRVSKRFQRDLVVHCLEGKTLYRDAAYLLGVKKITVVDKIAQNIGVGS